MTADGKSTSCCEPEQSLFGTKDTAFKCCPLGLELNDSNEQGSPCCLVGQEWDGEKCKSPDSVYENGKQLVIGKCGCPKGQQEGAGGVYKPKGKCSSGLESVENGLRWGYNNEKGGWKYCSDIPNAHHFFGKFHLCTDEACKPGIPVNPDTDIKIRDGHQNYSVDAAKGGAHIGITQAFANAGTFSLTRWSCGKVDV